MRLLSVGNAYPPHHLGGYEIVQQGLDRSLRAAGHTVRVLTTDLRLASADGQADSAPTDGGSVHRELRWYWHEHRWPDRTWAERLTLERHNAKVLDRHLSQLHPDVVAWWAMGGMSLSLIEQVRRAGVPAVLFVHDNWPRYGVHHDLWTAGWSRWPAPLRRAAGEVSGVPTTVNLTGAGRWLFNSSALRQQVSQSTGLHPPDAAVLSPGIEGQWLTHPAHRIRTATPPAWRWRLLYAGRVVEPKGVHTAIEALTCLPPQAELTIVGEGDEPYRRRLLRLAAERGLSARVHILAAQPRPELMQTMADADAVVFPVSWNEPWGLVPLEAMALGVPVLATGRGGSADYLCDGQNALLFTAGDVRGLTAQVSRLAADEALRIRLSACGRITAERHGESRFNDLARAELERAAQLGVAATA